MPFRTWFRRPLFVALALCPPPAEPKLSNLGVVGRESPPTRGMELERGAKDDEVGFGGRVAGLGGSGEPERGTKEEEKVGVDGRNGDTDTCDMLVAAW